MRDWLILVWTVQIGDMIYIPSEYESKLKSLFLFWHTFNCTEVQSDCFLKRGYSSLLSSLVDIWYCASLTCSLCGI